MRIFIHPLSWAAYAAAIMMLLMAVFPADVLQSALRGVSIWWQVLFPALFPFFVISELLIGFGIVHFCGKLLDPLMRPVFRLPGIGGFVVTMGYLSGYPVGARLTAKLRAQQLISRVEGERLVAFTTTSDPIFLIGAVSVGFFHNAAVAPVLAIAHYGGGLLIGLLMRFHEPEADTAATTAQQQVAAGKRSRIAAALHEMHTARLLDGRPFSQLLQDAISSALRLMMVVGGLVVFFSVIMELLTQAQLLPLLTRWLQVWITALGLQPGLEDAIIYGLFEVTLGAKAAGSAAGPLVHQVAFAAWVLSWGGLSVHAQVASLLSRTDIRHKPLLWSRALHGCIAIMLVYLIWPQFN